MDRFSLRYLSDRRLIDGLTSLAARERATTAELLAHLGETEARRLYRHAGCSSMFEYCVSGLRLSESSAYRRIQVARMCRKFPRLFAAIAEGRLNLTSVLLLRPHFTKANVDELIRAATHQRKAEIEHLIAARFGAQLAPELVGKSSFHEIAPGIFEMRVILARATVEKIRRAQDLLSHRIPSRNLASVLDQVHELAIAHLEKRKFAMTDRSQAARPLAADSRYVPAEVRRAVYARDGGQCCLIDARGRRCGSRHQVELDHIVPVAQGGKSTVDNLRTLCRAHNQLAAMDAFGLGFMRHKIEETGDGRSPEPSRALTPSSSVRTAGSTFPPRGIGPTCAGDAGLP